MKEHSIIKLGGGHFTCSKCGKTIFGSKDHKCNMITEKELKADCTPEIIKCMVELAEGFEYVEETEHDVDYFIFRDKKYFTSKPELFPLLIHRAVEGWNKTKGFIRVFEDVIILKRKTDVNTTYLYFKDYQPSSLTPCECACLHCLIEIFKEERK